MALGLKPNLFDLGGWVMAWLSNRTASDYAFLVALLGALVAGFVVTLMG